MPKEEGREDDHVDTIMHYISNTRQSRRNPRKSKCEINSD